MTDTSTTAPGSSRSAAVVGMIVTFLGGYVLGSMSASSREPVKDPAKVSRKSVPLGLSPARGPADALVTIVEFADFQCGFCARSVPAQHRLFESYGSRVRWVFKQLPLDFHRRARPAALASLAAAEQGKFWEYHDRLFLNQDQLSDDDLSAHAQVLGLDMERFRRDLQQKRFDKLLEADLDLARELKVEGTPNYYINGRHIMGSITYPRLESIVREEIAYAQKLLGDGVKQDALYQRLTAPVAGVDEKKKKKTAATSQPTR